MNLAAGHVGVGTEARRLHQQAGGRVHGTAVCARSARDRVARQRTMATAAAAARHESVAHHRHARAGVHVEGTTDQATADITTAATRATVRATIEPVAEARSISIAIGIVRIVLATRQAVRVVSAAQTIHMM